MKSFREHIWDKKRNYTWKKIPGRKYLEKNTCKKIPARKYLEEKLSNYDEFEQTKAV